MKKRLLYMTTENIEDIVYVGIQKKVYGQLDCFVKNDIESVLVYRNTCLNKVVRADNQELLDEFVSFTQKEYYEKILSLIKNMQTDILYIRYIMADEYLIDFFNKVKNELHIKIFMEIPTYPYDDVLNTNPEPNLIADRKWRGELKNYVDYLYNYSDFDEIYGIKANKIINGVNIDLLPVKKETQSDTFRMLSVSSVCRWHGYDRIIRGIYEYKKDSNNKENNKKKIKFTLAGKGNELNGLKALVAKYGLCNEVEFLGNVRDTDKLNELFDNADIGIGALALHRVNLKIGSAIKNQEYCARGIPFVMSVQDPNFIDVDFIKMIPGDDTAVDIEELMEFAQQMSNEETRNKMRKYAEGKFTWQAVLNEMIQEMKL